MTVLLIIIAVAACVVAQCLAVQLQEAENRNAELSRKYADAHATLVVIENRSNYVAKQLDAIWNGKVEL